MLRIPRFKPHLRVDVVPGEGVFVLAGARQTLLKGRLFELVVPLLGEGRSSDDLCDDLQGQAVAAEIYYVLNQLERGGYLCEEGGSLPPAEAALWSAQQVDPADAARRLADTTVMLKTFGVDATRFGALLESLGVRLGDSGSFGVVVTDDYLRADLEVYNAEALREKRPWLLLKPTGREVWLGPMFVPQVTGCWGCLADRLRSNRPVETYLAARNGAVESRQSAVGGSEATFLAAWALAANAIATWVVRGEAPALEGKIQTFDLPTWALKAHTLVRLPYCPACGGCESDDATGRPLVLEDSARILARDGGHRVVAPEVTLERYGHHISPITGAVSMLESVARVDGEGLQHTYLAGHNLARHHKDLAHLRGDLRSMASGKGKTDAQARASGLCEGLERYSGVYRGDEPRRRGRMVELGEAAVHPHSCLLFSDCQYRDRDEWNARGSRYNFIPCPFDPEAELEWTPAWSLTRDEVRFLPTAFCYYNYPYRGGKVFCLADSNGNAAGNTLEEAVLQGFLELVERDSVALWWYNRVSRPGVDLDGFSDPYFGRLRDNLRRRGRELWALDLTSDLGIPVFAALSRASSESEEQIILGFGAHLDARVALLRAVTEMSQMMAGLQAGRERKSDPIDDEETLHWLRTATVANQPYLLPDSSAPKVESSYAQAWSDHLGADIRACRLLVERHGMELIVLDQTRPEIGLPVAKVIVPGLRHFWARFAPGRLYDVPVRLGWIPAVVPEEDLNPIPMFL